MYKRRPNGVKKKREKKKNRRKNIKSRMHYLGGVYFFGFLLKAICFQNLSCLFFYFFITYYKLFTK